MKKENLKVYISILIIVLLISIILVITIVKKDTSKVEKNKNNISEKQIVENLSFEYTSLKYKDGMSTFETNVTNIGNDTEYLTEVKIHIKNKKNKEIMVLTGFVGDNIKSGESKIITSTYGQRLNNAYSVEYEIIK